MRKSFDIELWNDAYAAIQHINPRVAYYQPREEEGPSDPEAGLIRRLQAAIREMGNAEVEAEYCRLALSLSPNRDLDLHCRAIIKAVGFEKEIGPMKRRAAFQQALAKLKQVFPGAFIGVSETYVVVDDDDDYLIRLLEGFLQNTDEKFLQDYEQRRGKSKSFLDVAKIVMTLLDERISTP